MTCNLTAGAALVNFHVIYNVGNFDQSCMKQAGDNCLAAKPTKPLLHLNADLCNPSHAFPGSKGCLLTRQGPVKKQQKRYSFPVQILCAFPMQEQNACRMSAMFDAVSGRDRIKATLRFHIIVRGVQQKQTIHVGWFCSAACGSQQAGSVFKKS